jgi:Protein of unknown function (DUF2530)
VNREQDRQERMIRNARHHRSLLEQADIEPVDVDGVRAVTAGTVAWAVALVALLPFADRLRQAGADWWLWTCLTGVVLGILGVGYCVYRRARLRKAGASAQPRSRSRSVPS